MDTPAGCREVEVEQPDSDLVAVHEGLQADVVVADHQVDGGGSAGVWVGHLVAPCGPGRRDVASTDVMHPTEQGGRRRRAMSLSAHAG